MEPVCPPEGVTDERLPLSPLQEMKRKRDRIENECRTNFFIINQKTFWIEELLKQLKPYDNYTKLLKEVPAAFSANHVVNTNLMVGTESGWHFHNYLILGDFTSQ